MEPNKAIIREQFKITSSDQLYLNHAAKSPFPLCVREELDRFIACREYENVEYFPNLLQDKIELKQGLSRLLNADEKRISLVQNTVEGLNLLVDSLRWEKGDEVVVFQKDFPSNVHPFLKLERFGVRVRVVKSENLLFSTEDYLSLINENTKLVSISFVHFLSGQVADLETISKACKAHGSLFCVDSIQGCGAIQLDVETLGIDFISNGGHKWMMFPAGLGFVYFSEQLSEQMIDAKHGWLDREDAMDLFNWQNERFKDGRRFELGTGSDMLVACAKASLKWRESIGADYIEREVVSLSETLRKRLLEIGFTLIQQNNNISFKSGITSIVLSNAEEVFHSLHERKITLAVRAGVLRVSPHFYNDENDLDRLIEELKKFR